MADDEFRSWPDLLGQNGETVAEQLRGEGFTVFVVPEGDMVTMDWNPKRVRVFVDAAGHVAKPPQTG